MLSYTAGESCADFSMRFRLVELAGMLDLDDEFVTPAQAYSAVRNTVPNEKFLRPTLEALKQPLGAITKCQGFGAGMDAVLYVSLRFKLRLRERAHSLTRSQVLAAFG